MITAKCQLQVKYIRHTKETHYYRKYVVKPHLVPTQKGHILISTETLLAIVWRMRVGIDSPVSPLSSILKKWTSILAFSTDLSRIQAVSCMHKIGLRLQKMTSHILFFHWYSDTYKLMAAVIWLSGWGDMQRGQWVMLHWVPFLLGAETLGSPSAILCGTEPISALTLERFILLCSLYFFIAFHWWWSNTDTLWQGSTLDLTWNIRLQLFWSTWSKAPGQDLGHSGWLSHKCGPGTWAVIIAII